MNIARQPDQIAPIEPIVLKHGEFTFIQDESMGLEGYWVLFRNGSNLGIIRQPENFDNTAVGLLRANAKFNIQTCDTIILDINMRIILRLIYSELQQDIFWKNKPTPQSESEA